MSEMRKAFEAWLAADVGHLRTFPEMMAKTGGGNYMSHETAAMWAAWQAALSAPVEQRNTAAEIAATQAEDAGLWAKAQTATEAYLQQELRRLTAAVEAEALSAPALGTPIPPEDAWPTDGDSPLKVGPVLEESAPATPSKCPMCGGNDADVPCAYPSKSQPGCLRDVRLGATQPALDERAMPPLPEPANFEVAGQSFSTRKQASAVASMLRSGSISVGPNGVVSDMRPALPVYEYFTAAQMHAYVMADRAAASRLQMPGAAGGEKQK